MIPLLQIIRIRSVVGTQKNKILSKWRSFAEMRDCWMESISWIKQMQRICTAMISIQQYLTYALFHCFFLYLIIVAYIKVLSLYFPYSHREKLWKTCQDS